jgi:8-oxo-dGTP pyrophosphatase MutT (NUDIX family)
MTEKLFHVGIKALLQRPDGTVLVMKTGPFEGDQAHWDLAGGRISEGERELDTLRREIEEETGLTEFGKPEYFASCISNIHIPIGDTKVGLVLVAYLVLVPQDTEIRVSDEHTDIAWVDMAEAATRLSYKYPPEFIALLSR